MNGTIKKILADKAFGFIEREGQKPEEKDLFFHKQNVVSPTFEELKEGDKVSFEMADGPKGPYADKVTLVS
ncbi:MAG: cold-shock protein [Candidatus Yanofskybacteria bacterium RIFCSPLOWO2_02_FULL_47_9b]|uniref:Cold-shock protein n=1 Tax=Candidatus Yanofskybacteria bacterium RIFCSPLOWO2_02_FULL_47_9b TaxID=1802708 RepID=A0A1F8H9A9_9BACT|nr:MAG: cold-shock protein [Candidatus Yanofskybacteria bacterium RIFCSPLOWO2_02_FULL_47_9b]